MLTMLKTVTNVLSEQYIFRLKLVDWLEKPRTLIEIVWSWPQAMIIPDDSVLGDPNSLKFGILRISTKPFFVGIVRAKFVHRTKSSVPSPSATWRPCKWRGAPRLIRALDAATRTHAQFHCCAAQAQSRRRLSSQQRSWPRWCDKSD